MKPYAFMAFAEAPTSERKHRRIVATGKTEAEALQALGKKLAAAGVTDANVEVLPLSREDFA